MKKHNNLYVILALAVVLIGGVFVLTKIYQTSPSTKILPITQPQTKTFQSNNLNFSLERPINYTIEEKITTVLIKSGDREIILSRGATNFGSIEDYVKDLAQKNKLVITDQVALKINDLNSISSIIQSLTDPKKNDKTYFIYADNWVYTFSTSSQPLFDDLDRIARSFQYTP